MTLEIPAHLSDEVHRLVNLGYEPEQAVAKAANAARGPQGRPQRVEAPHDDPDTTPASKNALRASEGRCITVRIPMAPPAALLPNARNRRGGHHPGVSAANECREVARYAAMEHVNGTPIAGPVHLTLHVAYGIDPETKKARRLPDLDASIASAKGLIDGIVDAGLLYDDDQVHLLTGSHERLQVTRKHRPSGFTVIQIQEMQP